MPANAWAFIKMCAASNALLLPSTTSTAVRMRIPIVAMSHFVPGMNVSATKPHSRSWLAIPSARSRMGDTTMTYWAATIAADLYCVHEDSRLFEGRLSELTSSSLSTRDNHHRCEEERQKEKGTPSCDAYCYSAVLQQDGKTKGPTGPVDLRLKRTKAKAGSAYPALAFGPQPFLVL